jgi:exportin-2 (importin alpha re-exporter)
LKQKLQEFALPLSTLCCKSVLEEVLSDIFQQYAANPSQEWQSKDIAIYLVTALAVKSATAARGTTTLNILVPVMDFFGSCILPELQGDAPAALVLKADALKFVSTFRQQVLVKETLVYCISCQKHHSTQSSRCS